MLQQAPAIQFGQAFGNTVSSPKDLLMAIGALLSVHLFARDVWSKSNMVHISTYAVKLLADNKEKKLHFVHNCSTAITVVNRKIFTEGYSALENSDSHILGPALQYIALHAAMLSPFSPRRDRAANAARAWLQANEAEIPNVMASSLIGQAGMTVDLDAQTDARRLPGYRRLDPNFSAYNDEGVTRNPQFNTASVRLGSTSAVCGPEYHFLNSLGNGNLRHHQRHARPLGGSPERPSSPTSDGPGGVFPRFRREVHSKGC